MTVIFETHDDPIEREIVLEIRIPIKDLQDEKFMKESSWKPSIVQLLTFLLEKAQEEQNGQN